MPENFRLPHHDLFSVATNRPGVFRYEHSVETGMSGRNIIHDKTKWRKKSINFMSKCFCMIPKPITFFYNK